MKTQLDKISTALALLNSMVLCGENHSDQSTKIFYEASKAIGELYASQRDTEPKEEGEYFRKVIVNSKDDLPEEGDYFCNRNGFNSVQFLSNKLPEKSFMREIRWYLLPVSEPIREEGKGAEEIIKQEFSKYGEYIERGMSDIGARITIKEQLIKKIASLPAKQSVDVNFLLVNALRHLDNEQIKSLADSLYERIPAKQSE